jgi:sensor c-di-GMP phosphodiesterase-like protein
MKKLPVMPIWFALIGSLLIFVLSYSALGSFERILASRELSIQAGMMLRGFREGYERARADLMKLPPVEELHCRNELSNELAVRNFDNEYIRWFGVARNDKVICRGPLVGISFSDARFHHIDDTWSLVSVHSPGNTDNLMVAERRGDTQYLAMLEPLLFDFLHSIDCKNCISDRFIVNADSAVDMESPSTTTPTVISYTVEGQRLGTHMTFMLNATQQYVDAFSMPGRLISALIAAALAALFGIAVFAYMTRQTSVAFLIRQGLKRHEFLPYYQPIIDSRDGSVLGAEALVRWQTRRGELIPPGQFIPYAEENHLIGPITDQLVERVLGDIGRFGWQNTNRFVSINATPSQITETAFCSRLIAQIAETNIPAQNLSVEITERHQFPDLERGRAALRCLVDAGVEIKLDDAGTGYGGFSYVQKLPITTLKIDKMFVDTLRTESEDPRREVLRAIIEFARVAALEVIAEGVVTEDQVARLRDAGVYAIQGFVYAQPMPVEEFIRWTESRRQ